MLNLCFLKFLDSSGKLSVNFIFRSILFMLLLISLCLFPTHISLMLNMDLHVLYSFEMYALVF